MEYSAFALMCVIAIVAYSEISALKKVVRKQEKRLNQLAKKIGSEELSSDAISSELSTQLIQLTREGKKVKAIKILREHTQMDLLEAKQYVDALEE